MQFGKKSWDGIIKWGYTWLDDGRIIAAKLDEIGVWSLRLIETTATKRLSDFGKLEACGTDLEKTILELDQLCVCKGRDSILEWIQEEGSV